jgi:hypothetical protein
MAAEHKKSFHHLDIQLVSEACTKINIPIKA